MKIRPFKKSDATALATIFHTSVHKAAIKDYSHEQVMVWSPAKPAPETYLQKAQDRIIFVAEDDSGQIIGYGDLELNGHIDHLYTHPDWVGTGVGTAVYQALEAAARKRGWCYCLSKQANRRVIYLNVKVFTLITVTTSV
ncbi:GNAT family N-acetyltransferase [Serratia fonticola]|uniref:GNAT family N-acetyltransferase n=1 Tax=Serratia fonticola TaxID=47917 RepID=UPI00190F25FB|nr:GNAT family N-acetyltransferase [Serratia fonticola]